MVSGQSTIVVIDPPAGAPGRMNLRRIRRLPLSTVCISVIRVDGWSDADRLCGCGDAFRLYHAGLASARQAGPLQLCSPHRANRNAACFAQRDIDHALLNRLLNARFSPPDGIDRCAMRPTSRRSIMCWQRPIFWLSGGSLWALRLFGILISRRDCPALPLSGTRLPRQTVSGGGRHGVFGLAADA